MRILKWYVFRIGKYMYRIKCEPWYINELFTDDAIDEYRTCENKEEAIWLCCMFNNKKCKRRFKP